MWSRTHQLVFRAQLAPTLNELATFLLMNRDFEIYQGQDKGFDDEAWKQRVTLWDTRRQLKLSGRSSPMKRNLELYLFKRPHVVLYAGQDVNEQGTIVVSRPTLWNTLKNAPIRGKAVPAPDRLQQYLAKNPHIVMYNGQDRGNKNRIPEQVRRLSVLVRQPNVFPDEQNREAVAFPQPAYRLSDSNGSTTLDNTHAVFPSTCADMGSTQDIEYSTQNWLYPELEDVLQLVSDEDMVSNFLDDNDASILPQVSLHNPCEMKEDLQKEAILPFLEEVETNERDVLTPLPETGLQEASGHKRKRFAWDDFVEQSRKRLRTPYDGNGGDIYAATIEDTARRTDEGETVPNRDVDFERTVEGMTRFQAQETAFPHEGIAAWDIETVQSIAAIVPNRDDDGQEEARIMNSMDVDEKFVTEEGIAKEDLIDINKLLEYPCESTPFEKTIDLTLAMPFFDVV